MKVVVIALFALAAMASAQDRVKVVDENPDLKVNFVDNNRPGQQSPGNGQFVINNPDPGFYRPTNHDGNGHIVINNPDPGFYRPTNQNPNGPYEPISAGPAFVNTRPNPYPYKQYSHPGARSGR
ncbi:uncharacterized protein ACR2FA_005673 [Aphomia sociella]